MTRLTLALLLLLSSLTLCLSSGCKSSSASSKPDGAVKDGADTTGQTSGEGERTTPSKLAQPDWQGSPPGMPEER